MFKSSLYLPPTTCKIYCPELYGIKTSRGFVAAREKKWGAISNQVHLDKGDIAVLKVGTDRENPECFVYGICLSSVLKKTEYHYKIQIFSSICSKLKFNISSEFFPENTEDQYEFLIEVKRRLQKQAQTKKYKIKNICTN